MFGRGRRGRNGAGKHANTYREEGGGVAPEVPAEAAAPGDRPNGPWDVTEPAPDRPRVDLGALRVPAVRGVKVQRNVVEEEVVAATVAHEGSTLQLQVFAAPKTGGVWDEVRGKIATELRGGGGTVNEVDGPFGPELRSAIHVPGPAGEPVSQPVRFVGVDGPRWLLRGRFTGSAGSDSGQAQTLEEIFLGVIVVRGDAPRPPLELLPLQTSDQAGVDAGVTRPSDGGGSSET